MKLKYILIAALLVSMGSLVSADSISVGRQRQFRECGIISGQRQLQRRENRQEQRQLQRRENRQEQRQLQRRENRI